MVDIPDPAQPVTRISVADVSADAASATVSMTADRMIDAAMAVSAESATAAIPIATIVAKASPATVSLIAVRISEAGVDADADAATVNFVDADSDAPISRISVATMTVSAEPALTHPDFQVENAGP